MAPELQVTHDFEAKGERLKLTVHLPPGTTSEGINFDISTSPPHAVRISLDGADEVSHLEVPEEYQGRLGSNDPKVKFCSRRSRLSVEWPLSPVSSGSASSPAPPPPAMPPPAATAQDEPGTAADDGENDEVIIEEIHEEKAPSPVAAPASSNGAAPQKEVQKDKAAIGSIWNTNNWHWEERNCMELTKRVTEKSLLHCEATALRHIRELNGACVVLKNIDIRGKAGIWIRKGKRILSLEISVGLDWEVRDEFGGPLGVKGTAKAEGITEEKDEPAPTVEVKVSASSTGGKEARAAGDWVRKTGAKALAGALFGGDLGDTILEEDAQQVNPEADARKRLEERARAEAAEAATAAERRRIAEEERAKELSRSAPLPTPSASSSSSSPSALLTASSPQRIAPNNEGVAGASVWNANAWHWEERPVTDWAIAWLKKEIGAIDARLLGGLAELSFENVDVSGDASISVRKGKHVTLYSLAINCNWVVTAKSEGINGARGTLVVPEFNSEDGPRSSIMVEPAVKAARASAQAVVRAFHQEGVRYVRVVLNKFSQALMDKFASSK